MASGYAIDRLRELAEKGESKVLRVRAEGRVFAERDLEDYRSGKAPNNPKRDLNFRFYRNEIHLNDDEDEPTIDEIHKNWGEEYDLLERKHDYIQWLFPIHEKGMNHRAQVLQQHEAVMMRKDEQICERILRSYQLMLGFYGFRLQDRTTGELELADNYEERFDNLNQMTHNYLRISRILKCLGIFGWEHLKLPFLATMIEQMVCNNELLHAAHSLADFWIGTLLDEDDRNELTDMVRDHFRQPPKHNKKRHGSPKTKEDRLFKSPSKGHPTKGFTTSTTSSKGHHSSKGHSPDHPRKGFTGKAMKTMKLTDFLKKLDSDDDDSF